jgi:hypothetical protein
MNVFSLDNLDGGAYGFVFKCDDLIINVFSLWGVD